MRNKSVITILCAIWFMALSGFAQESKITKKELPPAVLKAFTTAYPKATIKGLSSEKEDGKTFFEIESVEGKTKRDLLYERDGSLVEIEAAIAAHELPDAVKTTIKREFPNGKVALAERTTKGNMVSYELRIMSGKSKVTLTINPEGKILSKESSGAKKEEKED